MPPEADAGQFPLDESRRLVRGLFEPNPVIYWADFLLSVSLTWSAFVIAVTSEPFSFVQIVCYLIASLALYRSVIFIHELSHFKNGTFGAFRLVWNLTAGLPVLVPAFAYRGVHSEHHRQRVYGTGLDGEYVPFVLVGKWSIVGYLLLPLILPAFVAFRSLVLTPLTYLSPGLARYVWRRASSLSIDLNYERDEATKAECPTWRLEQLGACLYAVTAVVLVALGWLGVEVLVLWYLVAMMVFFLNSLRTLAAHCYRNPADRHMNVSEQFLDSVDVPGNRFLTTLWAPVGLRYHATHHLFPSMPYHNLGRAYRILKTELPDNRQFLSASRESLWDALRRLWQEAGTVPRRA